MKKVTILLNLFLFAISGFAQQSFPFLTVDGKDLFDRIVFTGNSHLNDLYHDHTTSSDEFIFGREYIPYHYQSRKKPLLRNEEERSALLLSGGRSYLLPGLQYDTFTDEVIYSDNDLIYKNRIFQVALNNDYITGFDLRFFHDTMTFRYFRQESDTSFNLQDGFYELVYEGECRFIIKHVSTRAKYEGIYEYYYKPVFFISNRGPYYRVGSKKQLLALFYDKSHEMRQYLRTNRIWFHNAEKSQIADILRYYESLTRVIK